MWSVARRPKWIAALVFAFAVATVFALLGQWQLSRSFDSVVDEAIDTETSVPLTELAEPQTGITGIEDARMVELAGSFVPGEFVALDSRLSDGELGSWLVGHLRTDGGASIAVALGWHPEPEVVARLAAEPLAELVAGQRLELSGRYLAIESPRLSDAEAGQPLSTVSVAAFVNGEWADPGPVYGGYVAAADAPGELRTIHAPPPEVQTSLNWLNIFYAVEWAIFAGFALYLWYRLVRDAWEREQEELDDPESDDAPRGERGERVGAGA